MKRDSIAIDSGWSSPLTRPLRCSPSLCLRSSCRRPVVGLIASGCFTGLSQARAWDFPAMLISVSLGRDSIRFPRPNSPADQLGRYRLWYRNTTPTFCDQTVEGTLHYCRSCRRRLCDLYDVRRRLNLWTGDPATLTCTLNKLPPYFADSGYLSGSSSTAVVMNKSSPTNPGHEQHRVGNEISPIIFASGDTLKTLPAP